MKYIDAEKLKEEIERRRKFHDDAVIKLCNNRTIALTHSAGLKEDEELIKLIESLKQEEPDKSLDEAAEEWAENEAYGKSDAEFEMAYRGFKAGTEWMVAQGATCNGEIQMDFSEPDDIYARRLSADYWNELGPALMKVEPGKVLIQIRKK